MPTVRMPAWWRRPDPITRLRFARMVPLAMSKRGPRSGDARPTDPRWGLPGGRLSVPAPAWLPELEALELVEQRRAARVAASAAIAATLPAPVPSAEPEPEPVVGVRGLLGW